MKTRLNTGLRINVLDEVDFCDEIPRVVYQTYHSKLLPDDISENINYMKSMNSDWDFNILDDNDVCDFITKNYNSKVLNYYKKINPEYGPARADLFRYLALYKFGGVYLDIKSSCKKPLNDYFSTGHSFYVTQWHNMDPDSPEFGWAKHSEIAHIPGYEFQQWFICSAPGHPLMRYAIERIFYNIDKYNPSFDGFGKDAVLRVTGPIAYTLSLHDKIDTKDFNVKKYTNYRETGLVYSIYEVDGYRANKHGHEFLFKKHYTKLLSPVVKISLVRRIYLKLLTEVINFFERKLSA
ncbi:MAG: glycosyltransferase [Pseudomonadota bacterium]